jgi:hypothetical protein
MLESIFLRHEEAENMSIRLGTINAELGIGQPEESTHST